MREYSIHVYVFYVENLNIRIKYQFPGVHLILNILVFLVFKYECRNSQYRIHINIR